MDAKMSEIASAPDPPPAYEGVSPPPPSYEEVMQSLKEGQEAFHFPEAAPAPSPSQELFSSASTYARLTLLIVNLIGLVLLIYGGATGGVVQVVLGGLLFGVGYLIYWIDVVVWGSNFQFLSHKSPVADIDRHIQTVRAAAPAIVWIMECYHMEMRTRTVYSGSGRNRTSRIETYSVRVPTWSGQLAFQFAYWNDVSDPRQAERLQEADHTRVRFVKRYELSDQVTMTAFAGQRDHFVEANKHRDVNYELIEAFMLPGFVPATLASKSGERPLFLRLRWYLFAAVFLLELPFSYMIKKRSVLMEYVYVKRLTV